MPRFTYKAYDSAAEVVSGELTAADETSAYDALTAKGLTPFDLLSASDGPLEPWWNRDVHLFGGKVPGTDLANALASLALMAEAKVNLPEALGFTADETTSKPLKAHLSLARAEVIDGAKLADALGGRPDVLPERFLALVRIGEEANALPKTLRQAAELAEAEDRLRKEVSGALTYPLILLVASILVVIAIVFLLAPTLVPVFEAVRADPPWTIQAMMAVRNSVLDYWELWLAGLGGMVGGVIALMRTGVMDARGLLTGLPGIGPILHETEIARSIGALSLLLENGAQLTTSLRVAGETVSSNQLARFFETAEDHVLAGGRLSESIEPGLLPESIAHLIKLGEETNRLAPMLRYAAKTLETRATQRIKRLTQILTPALTLIIGVIVGGLIFTTLSAVLDINDLALR